MSISIKDRLTTAFRQLLASGAGGSASFAVADGYQAIDNYVVALLISHGLTCSKPQTEACHVHQALRDRT
jgi:hypothetical protein